MTLADDVRMHAARIDHEWDRRAIDWPLTPESVVVEVGGYTGRWALQIAERYGPRLYVFEPQHWAYTVCCEVLADRATVEPYGLGAEDGYLPMGAYGTDGSSFVSEQEPFAAGQLKDIGAAFRDLEIRHIDLMLMNIEGYEYALLPHMLGRGILPDRLMVQFHPPEPGGMLTGQMFERLADAGYRVAWTYGVVLTAWERV